MLKLNNVIEWIDERTSLKKFLQFLSNKKVPQHRFSFWYILGGLTLFFFITQVISGVLLLFYYSPTPENAYESVQFILNQVRHGWLIRSIHIWGAHLMIVCVLLHMFSVYFLTSYRKPRELMWCSGVILLFLVLGFGFTGYLLPWDNEAFFGTVIGTEIPKSIPVMGEFVVKILRGGDEVGGETLKRLFAMHVVLLPLLTILFITMHITLNQVKGSSVPIGIKMQSEGTPFYPNYIMRDMLAWTIGLILLLSLAIIFPLALGEKADPLSSTPQGIKPEWFFLPLYQTLRFFPSEIAGINGELLVNIFVAVFASLWLIVPFIDFPSQREEKGMLFKVIGYILIIYIAVTIVIATTT
ncbi:MAG: cytochrome bc complex cytochrome b subunit [Bacteroidota bacterium]